MTETTVGREPIQIVEILQPICENVFGTAPCTATGTADTKCYNTRATCQDTVNYALDATPLSLYFAKGNVVDAGIAGTPYIFPALVSVSTAPTRINLAGANPDASGLGNRAICNIVLADFQHSDRIVDPYVDGRSWNPLSADRGSFWSRWFTRNKYRQNIQIKIYEGYSGQTLAQMNVRTFFLERATSPDASGRVTFQGKDILARLEARKAQAPIASPGLLYAGISAVATSIEVANAVEADYPATGTLRIDDELMTYTARATSANGITFTGVARGTDNTTAATHDVDAAVQECLRYTSQSIPTILEDLMTTYAGVASSWLDTAGWTTEVSTYLSFYNLTTIITEPTSVTQLVAEMQEQCLFNIWWDERDALVKLKAVRGVDEDPPTITDAANIIAGTFSIQEMPRQRVSQAWIYYNLEDYLNADQKSFAPFKSQYVAADLDSETDELYGSASIRKIWSRWIDSDALAANSASKIVLRYVDVPSLITFEMDAKDRSYWVGDTVKINHYLDVDQYGDRRVRQWTIVSAEETAPGEVIRYEAEDTTLYGVINYIMASGAADYPGADSAPFKNCYIGDASGLLSDGSPCGRIS